MRAKFNLGSLLFSLFLASSGTPPATAAPVTTETKLIVPLGARELMFATDVAINADTAAVGALLPPFNANGGVYIFTLIGTNWLQGQLLTSGKAFDSFGAAVDLSTDTLFVGDPTAPPVSRISLVKFLFTPTRLTSGRCSRRWLSPVRPAMALARPWLPADKRWL